MQLMMIKPDKGRSPLLNIEASGEGRTTLPIRAHVAAKSITLNTMALWVFLWAEL